MPARARSISVSMGCISVMRRCELMRAISLRIASAYLAGSPAVRIPHREATPLLRKASVK